MKRRRLAASFIEKLCLTTVISLPLYFMSNKQRYSIEYFSYGIDEVRIYITLRHRTNRASNARVSGSDRRPGDPVDTPRPNL